MDYAEDLKDITFTLSLTSKRTISVHFESHNGPLHPRQKYAIQRVIDSAFSQVPRPPNTILDLRIIEEYLTDICGLTVTIGKD